MRYCLGNSAQCCVPSKGSHAPRKGQAPYPSHPFCALQLLWEGAWGPVVQTTKLGRSLCKVQ